MRGRLTAACLLASIAAAGRSVAQSAYITNSADATVSVIDTVRGQVAATFKLDGLLGAAAVSPDGTRLYVADGQNHRKNTVTVLDTRSGQVVRTVQVGDTPGALAASPDGAAVYSAEDNFVSVIDTASDTVAARLKLVTLAAGVDVSPDSRTVFVSSPAEAAVEIIDARTRAVQATVALPGIPGGLACAPDGRRVYVADTESGTLAVIDVARRLLSATIPVGRGPFGVAVSPDGTRVYVADAGHSPREHGASEPGSVAIVDAARLIVLARVRVGQEPHGIAVTPDGLRVYAVNTGSDTVSVIDTRAQTVSATIPVGHAPSVSGRFIGPRSASR